MNHNTNHTESTKYRAYEMRLMGNNYPMIADAFGLTPEGAYELVRLELEQSAALRDPETEYLLAVERLRRMLGVLEEKFESRDKEAVSLTIRILELWESMKADRAAKCAPKE